MTKEGSGIRVYKPKPLTMDDIRLSSTEEGNCLLWGGAVTPKGFPYVYIRSEKVNLRPYVYSVILGKKLNAGSVISVRCNNRECLSEHCLVQKTISQVRKDVHAKHRQDPASYAKSRNGIKAAGKMKLDMGKAMDIRRSAKTSKELAEEYAVTPRTIQEIRSGRTYVNPMPVNSIFALAESMGVA